MSESPERATNTRLGLNVDRTRKLQPVDIERTLACLRTYTTLVHEYQVDKLAVVATSASRDADGASLFLDAAEQVLGVRPRVVSGETEAYLTFLGSLSGLPAHGTVFVQDVGGGSTEIVEGAWVEGTVHIHRSTSLQVGSVRLTERCVRHDPQTSEELESIRRELGGD